MYSLKASLKALINLTNIPCFEPEENGFNPKGNMKVKRELFLDKSPSSGWSLGPGANPESHPQHHGAAGDGHARPPRRDTDTQGTRAARDHPMSACLQVRAEPGSGPRVDLCLHLQGLQVHLWLLNVFMCELPVSTQLPYPRCWRSRFQGQGCRV